MIVDDDDSMEDMMLYIEALNRHSRFLRSITAQSNTSDNVNDPQFETLGKEEGNIAGKPSCEGRIEWFTNSYMQNSMVLKQSRTAQKVEKTWGR